MKRLLIFGLLIITLLSLSGFAPAPAVVTGRQVSPRTYTVLVGLENSKQGVSIMSYFPGKLRIHVGDTVMWKANSHEIHTVSFLAGAPMPDFIVPAPSGQVSPVMINPLAGFPAAPANGLYDGTTFANSGLMSVDPGQVTTFRLTFTQTGRFEYVCIVHGMMMSAEIDVVAANVPVPSPAQVRLQARAQELQAWSKVPGVLAEAARQVVPPVRNQDGTYTRTVMVGYSSGVVDVMRFFPKNVIANPGDTIVWKLSPANVAPHTVTFLNGNPDPEIVVPVPQPNGPPLLLINPKLLFPSPNSLPVPQTLNKTDYFNSGFLQPAPVGPTSFAYKVGDVSGRLPYLCALHDTSGMVGSVVVRDNDSDGD